MDNPENIKMVFKKAGLGFKDYVHPKVLKVEVEQNIF